MTYKIYLSESDASLEIASTPIALKEFGVSVNCIEENFYLSLNENELEELIMALNIVRNEIRERND
jgi:hypothetical protein